MGLVHDKMGHGVANVHRLDADRSGLLLCAKDKVPLDFLGSQFQSKTVRKIYHAFVVVLPVGKAMKVVAPVRTPTAVLPEAFDRSSAQGRTSTSPVACAFFASAAARRV